MTRWVRYKTGKLPNTYGYDLACVITTFSNTKGSVSVTFAEVMSGSETKKWTDAMKFEIKSLEELGAWNLVKQPQRRKVVKTKWVYEAKWHGEGKILRYEARLVAKGFSQIPRIDFQEVFSLVSRFAIIRMIFALAVIFRVEAHAHGC